MSDKLIIHLTFSSNGRVHRKSDPTICGKQIGATCGYVTISDYASETVRSEPSPYKYYVNLTKQGKEALNLKGAAFAKFDGYYATYLAVREFELCKDCENSEEVGMEILYYL